MTTSEPIEPTRAASTSVPVRQPAPPHGVLRALLSLPVHLYHARLGFLLGHRFLLLVHTGRRTGGGFKGSSQRCLVELRVGDRRGPRQGSSSRASCEACC
jgi:hypothetical protein